MTQHVTTHFHDQDLKRSVFFSDTPGSGFGRAVRRPGLPTAHRLLALSAHPRQKLQAFDSIRRTHRVLNTPRVFTKSKYFRTSKMYLFILNENVQNLVVNKVVNILLMLYIFINNNNNIY